jgi:hypothetical protein
MNATTISFDIAKGVIQLHGVDACFAVTPRKRLSRTGGRKFFASLLPCLVGMEACGGARYWARELTSFGHAVRPISPLCVKPRVKRSKTDAADAAASRRGGEPATYAFCADQEPRRAGFGAGLQNARSLGGAAHGARQRVARAFDRVWRRRADWARGRGAADCAGAGEGSAVAGAVSYEVRG